MKKSKKLSKQQESEARLFSVLFDPDFLLKKLLADPEKAFQRNEQYYLLNSAEADKYLLTISSAGIGLLLVFIKERGPDAIFVLLGFCSVLALSLSLIFLVCAALTSISGNNVRRIQQDLLFHLPMHISDLNNPNKLTKDDLQEYLKEYQILFSKKAQHSEYFRLLSIVTFLTGTTAGILFVSLNLIEIVGIAIPFYYFIEIVTFVSVLVIPFLIINKIEG